MKNRVEKIQEYTETAVRIMNEELSFERMRVYLEKAFVLCSPTEDLAYYQIMATVFTQLYFRTKTAFGTGKVKKQYGLLYEYIDSKFASIVNFNADINSEEEAGVVNSICCDIYNGANRYYEALAKAYMNGGSVFGLIGLGIGYSKVKPLLNRIKSMGKSAARILRKYNTTDVQILQNIKTFANEK